MRVRGLPDGRFLKAACASGHLKEVGRSTGINAHSPRGWATTVLYRLTSAKAGASLLEGRSSGLSAMLAAHLNHFGNRFDADALVFTSERGHPVLQSGFRKNVFDPASLRAGIEPAPRANDLRTRPRRSWGELAPRSSRQQSSSATLPRP